MRGQGQVAFDLPGFEQFGGVAGHAGHQAVGPVVAGVDAPDNVVEGAADLVHLFGHAFEQRGGRMPVGQPSPGHHAQDAHPAERRPDLVVQVGRNAVAHVLHPQQLPDPVAVQGVEQRRPHPGGQQAEPPGLVVGRQHPDAQLQGPGVPIAQRIARLHVQRVRAGVEVGVIRPAGRSTLPPGGLEAGQVVGVLVVVQFGVVEGGEIHAECILPGPDAHGAPEVQVLLLLFDLEAADGQGRRGVRPEQLGGLHHVEAVFLPDQDFPAVGGGGDPAGGIVVQQPVVDRKPEQAPGGWLVAVQPFVVADPEVARPVFGQSLVFAVVQPVARRKHGQDASVRVHLGNAAPAGGPQVAAAVGVHGVDGRVFQPDRGRERVGRHEPPPIAGHVVHALVGSQPHPPPPVAVHVVDQVIASRQVPGGPGGPGRHFPVQPFIEHVQALIRIADPEPLLGVHEAVHEKGHRVVPVRQPGERRV